ncbi:hypothetical protein BC937DRAFT_86668 [Endogone sp. FLAS-F59071]|nr:hypothetical protein BC937DRAFT_86668 [Endogone sp. FLAS-F59071]|eukprot:RUS19953.1 hypothetical protein BC937DRAFT_86668 [Endogone sp. FLAS-F59071]
MSNSSPTASLRFHHKLLIVLISLTCLYVSLYLKMSGNFLREQSFPTLAQHNSSLCSPTTFSEGTFVREPLNFEVSNKELQQRACIYANFSVEELLRWKNAMEWSWQPNSCSLLPFNPTRFISHLEENPLLLLGDSITSHQFTSLSCMLSKGTHRVHDPFDLMPELTMRWRVQLQSENSAKVNKTIAMFTRTDYLVRSRDLQIVRPGEDPGVHWKKKTFPTNLPILEAYSIMIDRVLNHFVTEYPHARVFVRGSIYGHLNCSQYTEPFTTPKSPTLTPETYNWNDILPMNEMWKASYCDTNMFVSAEIQPPMYNAIRTLNNPQITYLDISFTELRGDGHSDPEIPDCLHYLQPGPMELWNKLLYHEIFKEMLPAL